MDSKVLLSESENVTEKFRIITAYRQISHESGKFIRNAVRQKSAAANVPCNQNKREKVYPTKTPLDCRRRNDQTTVPIKMKSK